MSDWKSIVSSVAPVIGTALGGPFGGMAAKVITGALLGEDQKTDDLDMAKQAIQNASPSDLLALKQADNDFKAEMKKLGVDLERIHAADRHSARLMQTQTRSTAPALIATVVLLGFFGILIALIFVEIPAAASDPLKIMLGSLGTIVIAIANFYYGSSQGSRDKTDLLKSGK